MLEKLTIFLSLTFTIIVLLLMAFQNTWHFNLHTDIITYLARANHFWTNGSFENLNINEYQSGALFFFLAISPSLLFTNNLQSYLIGLFVVNILLLTVISYLYSKYSEKKDILLLSPILLFTGPIVLYRLEFFVMTFVIMSFYLFKKNLWILSTMALSFASLIKIFPVVFLPYFLIVTFRNEGLKKAFLIVFVYFVSYILYLGIFSFVTGLSLDQFLGSFSFIANAPIHNESLWGTLTGLYWLFTSSTFVQGAGAWGIFGVAQAYQLGPLWIYNFFWIIPIFVFYLYIFLKSKKMEMKFDIKICLLVILLFLLFSKILNHQYILWFMLLLPLVSLKSIMQHSIWIVVIFLTLLMTFISQYIYPLNYTDWVTQLYVNGTHLHLFWLNTIRNIILVILFVLLFKGQQIEN